MRFLRACSARRWSHSAGGLPPGCDHRSTAQLHAAAETEGETSVSHNDDRALIAACLRGEQAAWVTLVERYNRLVYSVPRRAGLSEMDSEDVMQAVFTALFQRLAGVRRADRLSAWLVTAAKRETIAAQKRLCARASRPYEAHDWNGDLQRIEERDALERAIDALPAAQGAVLRLALEDGSLPEQEIARRAGLSVGSVRTTRTRGLLGLRRLLDG